MTDSFEVVEAASTLGIMQRRELTFVDDFFRATSPRATPVDATAPIDPPRINRDVGSGISGGVAARARASGSYTAATTSRTASAGPPA